LLLFKPNKKPSGFRRAAFKYQKYLQYYNVLSKTKTCPAKIVETRRDLPTLDRAEIEFINFALEIVFIKF